MTDGVSRTAKQQLLENVEFLSNAFLGVLRRFTLIDHGHYLCRRFYFNSFT